MARFFETTRAGSDEDYEVIGVLGPEQVLTASRRITNRRTYLNGCVKDLKQKARQL